MLQKKIGSYLLWIFSFVVLGYFATEIFYKMHHKFSDPNSALHAYISVLVLLFCCSYCLGHMLSLIKLKPNELAEKVICVQIPVLTISAYFFHQKQLSEFNYWIMGKYIFTILLAFGLIFVFRKINKFIYLKFIDFFKKFSFACQFLLYTASATIFVFMMLLLSFDSFIFRVLALFGAS